MKVKMMFLFQVMLNSARGMQIFGTMEKGVLVPDVSLILIIMVTGQDDDGNDDHGHGERGLCSDVSSPSLFTIQECVFIDIGKHKWFFAPKVEKSTKKKH